MIYGQYNIILNYIMVFSVYTFSNLQNNTFAKKAVVKPYCIFNEPKSIYSNYNSGLIKKTQVRDINTVVYNQGKIKANSPNQSKKLEYAAFARRFGTTTVIGPC
jgi:hypothetical protein